MEDGKSYGLEPGQSTKYGEIYSVSMYHQLHCLGLLRQNYWRVLDAIGANDHVALEAEYEKQTANAHTGHCFDYIRQGLQCAGDMTLEWPRTDADGRRFQVDGYGMSHVCKSPVRKSSSIKTNP